MLNPAQWYREFKQRRLLRRQMHRLDRAELQAAINVLDHRRNNVEELVRRMLEERNA